MTRDQFLTQNLSYTISRDVNVLNIEEFKLPQQDLFEKDSYDISVKQVDKINLHKDVINVSEGIYCLAESIYIKDNSQIKMLILKS